MERLLLLGEDYASFGSVHVSQLNSKLVAAISVGSDTNSPSMINKGSPDCPNEDGALAIQDENMCLMAVADGHFGSEASHLLLAGLSDVCRKVPTRAGELNLLLAGLNDLAWEDGSGSTLIVTVLNQETRSCFGVSWGDSMLLSIGPSGCSIRSSSDERYIHCGDDCHSGEWFDFQMGEGDVLTLCTDGIFECHYGSPLTSVRPQLMQELWRSTNTQEGFGLASLASAMAQLALKGVNGFPGGQDNIGLVLAQA